MMMLKDSIEKKREEMHELVEKYGFLDDRVLEKSMQLDKLLNQYIKEHMIKEMI